MAMTTATRLLAALAFCVSSITLLSTAQAKYTILIDCHGTDGLPTWAPTSDTITMEVWFQDVLTDTTTFKGFTYCNADIGLAFTGKLSAYPAGITKIRFTTNGSNAWWIDKLILTSSSSDTVPTGDGALQWGTDNNVGWCMSKEAADGNNSYCLGATAYTTKSFIR